MTLWSIVPNGFWKSRNISQPKLSSFKVCLILSGRSIKVWVDDLWKSRENIEDISSLAIGFKKSVFMSLLDRDSM